MIDILADAYGWSKSQINEIYPDEAVIYLKKISQRKIIKRIELLQSWLIQVVANNTDDPNKVADDIKNDINDIVPKELKNENTKNDNRPYWEVTELDRTAMNKAKESLQKVRDSR